MALIFECEKFKEVWVVELLGISIIDT